MVGKGRAGCRAVLLVVQISSYNVKAFLVSTPYIHKSHLGLIPTKTMKIAIIRCIEN